MRSNWSCSYLKEHRSIKFTKISTYLFAFALIISISYYCLTQSGEFQGVIRKNLGKYTVNDENRLISSIRNGFNSCPKPFRTHQPLFPWPPTLPCNRECAVSALHAVLPSILWFAEKHEQFSNFNIVSRPEKWFNLAYELSRTADRLLETQLFPSTKREFVLDIGTGFGYLPFFINHFNHCVIGTNLYEHELNREMKLFQNSTNILGIDVRPHKIIPMTSMPINLFDGIKFSVVTAYLGWFHCRPRAWELADWMFFLTDIANHHTTDNARAYFDLNMCTDKQGKAIGALWSNATMTMLEHKGTRFIDRNHGTPRMIVMNLSAFRS